MIRIGNKIGGGRGFGVEFDFGTEARTSRLGIFRGMIRDGKALFTFAGGLPARSLKVRQGRVNVVNASDR